MTAYIHRIRIDQFRTIKDLDIDLRPRTGDAKQFRHLVLTGPNGSGKSSALLALAQSISGAAPDRHATWSSKDRPLVIYIQTHRQPQFAAVAGPKKLEFPQGQRVYTGLAGLFLQYLVNRKAEQAFANIDKKASKEAEHQRWFEDFQAHLRWLFEDPGLVLEFDSKRFDFSLRHSDGQVHGFQHLADGHGAFLSIFAEIVLGIEEDQFFIGRRPGEQEGGVVLLDEIENHLHLRLQEQALPFLTKLFPGFQFITATHSPAVISSVSDAIVFDMARREATPSEESVFATSRRI